jgi:predicted NAD-dependent protein-ADP-ribosyltransferase YbiA (DUF1768 family)
MAETEQVEPAAEAVKLEAPADPYDKETTQAINMFFKKKGKKGNQSKFTFTSDGNLETKDPAGTIQLKSFVPLEQSDRAALDEYRLNSLAELQELYEKELIGLRETWEKYREHGTVRPVLIANQRVAELDARMCAMRSAVRDIMAIKKPVTNTILLNKRHDVSQLFPLGDPFKQTLMRLAFYDFKPEHELGKYVAQATTPQEEGAEPSEMLYQQSLKDGRRARIFFETDSDVNGFLSPYWPVEFVLEETKYSSALQAYEAERAKELKMDELRKQILGTRSPRTIRLLTKKVLEHPRDSKGLWLKIFTQIYQDEHLRERLLSTGTDALVYADLRAGPSGIALAEKDSGVLDPTKWKGENAVGLALETVRTTIREGALKEAPDSKAKESVITEEEQEKAKLGAIINAKRGGFRH